LLPVENLKGLPTWDVAEFQGVRCVS